MTPSEIILNEHIVERTKMLESNRKSRRLKRSGKMSLRKFTIIPGHMSRK